MTEITFKRSPNPVIDEKLLDILSDKKNFNSINNDLKIGTQLSANLFFDVLEDDENIGFVLLTYYNKGDIPQDLPTKEEDFYQIEISLGKYKDKYLNNTPSKGFLKQVLTSLDIIKTHLPKDIISDKKEWLCMVNDSNENFDYIKQVNQESGFKYIGVDSGINYKGNFVDKCVHSFTKEI